MRTRDQNTSDGERVIPQVKAVFLNDLPFPSNLKGQTEISRMVEQLKNLQNERISSTLDTITNQIQSKIDYCEEKINELVYQLYGLTKKEIDLIETQFTEKISL